MPDAQIPVEAMRLKDVRSRIERSERELASARRERDHIQFELRTARRENDRLKSSRSELTEALRQVQVAYWEASKQIEAIERLEAELILVLQERDDLKAQMRRVVESRAWRLISAYRRVAKSAFRRNS